ncbi:MAG: hypothetical protein VYE68_01290 [Acidobacteriota bacterium]|nr:hypothetical protein [Acidobacteriota bacterium]
MMQPPNEDDDVICHQIPDPNGGTCWTIHLGADTHGQRDSLTEAITLARQVAVSRQRPAWLLDDTGYPLKPMFPWAP